MIQALEVLGSLLILAPFTAVQRGVGSAGAPPCLAANLVGSALLTATAVAEFQVGFALLEGCWAIISAWSLVRWCLRMKETTNARV